MEYTVIEGKAKQSNTLSDDALAGFLFMQLEKYADPLLDIKEALDFVHKKGGFIVAAYEGKMIKGAVVIAETGMRKYMPENVLVYIAVDASSRGQGIGTKLVEMSLEKLEGEIAIHLKTDNPAKKLFENQGFEKVCMEMRYKA